jgi:hypothetical protein
MNVEIGTEAEQFLFREFINRILIAVCVLLFLVSYFEREQSVSVEVFYAAAGFFLDNFSAAASFALFIFVLYLHVSSVSCSPVLKLYTNIFETIEAQII